MANALTHRSTARVATDRASRYMEQMLKHFGHKIPVTRGDGTGSIVFSGGTCALGAGPDALVMTVDAPTAEGRATVEDVVARHLVRFAFREDLKVVWEPVA